MWNRTVVALTGIVLAAAGLAQQPQVKDQGEYDLYNSILKTQNDPNKQLQLLNAWQEKYPDSGFKLIRADLFARDYLALNQPAQAVKAAQEALSLDPKDAPALIDILRAAPYVQPPTADLEKAAEAAAGAIIDNWDSLKPKGVSDADWSKAKAEIEPAAQYTLGWAKVAQKDYPSAEKPLKCALATAGNPMVQYGLAAYWLGAALYAQNKVPEGLYQYARAAVYTGPGALDPAARTKADAFLENAYTGYHGDRTGLDDLKQLAVKAAFPPAGFTIQSVQQIQDERQAEAADFATRHPDIALWRLLRTALEGDGAAAYFDQSLKSALVPPQTGDFKRFKAKVIARPNPKELLVSVDDPAGDATLLFAAPLRETISPGQEIEFAGVVEAYTNAPFSLRFTVDKKDLDTRR